jgi:hypothetical protein
MSRRSAPSGPKTRSSRRKSELSASQLDALIEEATVDAYNESEQLTSFSSMLEEHVTVPFKTEVLGVEVTVERIELTEDERVVAVCARGKSRQRIDVLEVPLPDPPPKGSEWIHAYRRWAGWR